LQVQCSKEARTNIRLLSNYVLYLIYILSINTEIVFNLVGPVFVQTWY